MCRSTALFAGEGCGRSTPFPAAACLLRRSLVRRRIIQGRIKAIDEKSSDAARRGNIVVDFPENDDAFESGERAAKGGEDGRCGCVAGGECLSRNKRRTAICPCRGKAAQGATPSKSFLDAKPRFQSLGHMIQGGVGNSARIPRSVRATIPRPGRNLASLMVRPFADPSTAMPPLRILYAAGPGDVIGTYRHWKEGRDDPSQIAITYSGQFYSLCKELARGICHFILPAG